MNSRHTISKRIIRRTAFAGTALVRWIIKNLSALIIWACARRVFWSMLAIGMTAAFFAREVPIIGNVLSLLIIVLAAIHSLGLQLDADRRRRFRDAYQTRDDPGYYDQMM